MQGLTTRKLGGFSVKRLGILVLLVMFCMMPVNAQYVGSYDVYNDGEIIGATSRCSCGMGHYGYETRYWVNYCPYCNQHGTLAFEQGPYSGAAFTSPEGLIFCQRCDMDWCIQCGHEHIAGSPYWLTPSDPPKPKPKKVAKKPKYKEFKIDMKYKTKKIRMKTKHAEMFGV